ncbi:MAG: FecR domain-containing protein, partial [Chitinophagaceae bacterium]|nr:FecR domain-containing protein [Chitinophagaceae bacterium]
MENNDYFKELLLRYARGNISDQEKEALFASLNEQANEDLWKDRIRELSFTGKAGDELHTVDWEPVIRSILSSAPAEAPVAGRRIRLLKQWRNIAAAATITLLAGAAYYIYSGAPEKPVAQTAAAEPVKDIAPGKDGAILTLSDGSAIVLDNLESGLVSTQGNAQLIISNGQLAYKQTGTASDEILYNTITTPRGRQYRLQLPDGTEVWLNAASSIRYPTAFAGGERKVSISGEAYFEVAKRPDMPFKVIAGGSSEIEALGTHFNVNAYTDETSLNTTLLEGLIKVSAVNDKPVLVKP